MDTIQSLIHLGISVIPIAYRDKRPLFRALPRDDAGDPSWEIFKTRLPETGEILSWISSGALANYGVVTGWRNLVVLDFDDAQEYSRWLLWAMQKGGTTRFVAEQAYRVRTARGMHVYIRTERPERGRKLGRIDIKAGGGYVLGAGSTHPSGAIYTELRHDLFFPVVQTLSEALPAELLTVDVSVPGPARTAVDQPAVEYDPWAAAMHPAITGGVTVEDIRKAFRVEDFLTNLVDTSRDGRWKMCLCPFHDDHHPSMWVDTEHQICQCLRCDAVPMDVINLYARLHGLTNREAIVAMAQLVR